MRRCNARLHAVDLTKKFIVAGVEVVTGDAEPVNPVRAKDALIGEIMNGVDAARARDGWIMLILRRQQQRDHAGLPVVAVDNIHIAAQLSGGFQGDTIKEQKAQQVVVIGAAGRPVNTFAIKQIILLHQQIVQAVHHGLMQRAVALNAIRPHFDMVMQRRGRNAGCSNMASVKWHNDSDAMSELLQRMRQRTGDIGQTAGFGQWRRF